MSQRYEAGHHYPSPYSLPYSLITTSDDRTNGRWLVAEADRSFTFDVGVVNLSKTRGLKANDYKMIFVDPTGAPDTRGLIRAKTMTFDECRAKFAP